MSGTTPVKIGTRGTVGSLVRQEIEYFSKLEVVSGGKSQEPQLQNANNASSTGSFKQPKLGFVNMKQQRKNKKKESCDGGGGGGSGGFIPSICSVVEVSESRLTRRLSYKNLRTDSKELEG